MSGEHHISRNQFGDGPVTVQGLPWCRTEARTIGVDRLVSKVLCTHHNNTTSPLDGAAGDLLGALRAIAERADRVTKGERRQPRRVVRISGDLLERWLLKTTINLALQAHPAPTGGIFDLAGKPARRYIDIVYGRAMFGPEEGLTWVAQVGDNIPNAEHGTIRFQTWTKKEDGALVAAFMTFHGQRLWLATVDAPKIEHGLHPIRAFDAENVDMRIEFQWSKPRRRQFMKLQGRR
jgi:hypothetical protein